MLKSFEALDTIQSRDCFQKQIKGWWHGRHSARFFVANVNFNADDRLKVNVNRLENDNVWNAEYQHCVVIPKLAVSPVTWREFSFPILSSIRRACALFRITALKAVYTALGKRTYSQGTAGGRILCPQAWRSLG